MAPPQDVTDQLASDEPQPKRLAGLLAHVLEVIEVDLEEREISVPNRPFKATVELLRLGLVEVNSGGEPIDTSRLVDYVAEPWFRALYTGVEEWYRDHFGSGALAASGNPPLIGAVLIRGASFLVRVPMHRNEVEIEGKTAWMYFESGIGELEDPRTWIVAGPNPDRLSPEYAGHLDSDLRLVAGSLRAVQHHLLGAGQDEAQSGLKTSIRSYLEAAAQRLASKRQELALGWMDLQMAAEAALKLVILRGAGTHPHIHSLVDLLRQAALFGVEFDADRLSGWPGFAAISDRRYGKGYDAGLAELYDAYKLMLELVTACVLTIKAPLPSGAGLLLHVAPWLIDDPLPPIRNGTNSGDDG